MQPLDCVAGPSHGRPPIVAVTLTLLVLSCRPPPQDFEQDPHSPQGFHSQSAAQKYHTFIMYLDLLLLYDLFYKTL